MQNVNNSLKKECEFIKATTTEQSRLILSISDTIDSANTAIHKLNASSLSITKLTKETQSAIQAITNSIPHIHTIADSATSLTKLTAELKNMTTTQPPPLPALTTGHVANPTYTNIASNPPTTIDYPPPCAA